MYTVSKPPIPKTIKSFGISFANPLRCPLALGIWSRSIRFPGAGQPVGEITRQNHQLWKQCTGGFADVGVLLISGIGEKEHLKSMIWMIMTSSIKFIEYNYRHFDHQFTCNFYIPLLRNPRKIAISRYLVYGCVWSIFHCFLQFTYIWYCSFGGEYKKIPPYIEHL